MIWLDQDLHYCLLDFPNFLWEGYGLLAMFLLLYIRSWTFYLLTCKYFVVPDYQFLQALLEYEKHKMGAGELTEPNRVNSQVI